MIRLVCILLVFLVGCTTRPAEQSLTPCVSSRIATHSDDPTYAVFAELHNRSIDVNRAFQRLNDLQQYPNIIALARIRRAELDWAIRKVQGMGLVAQQRDRVLTAMREEQSQMLRVIAARTKVR
jgi:hypothetical protein